MASNLETLRPSNCTISTNVKKCKCKIQMLAPEVILLRQKEIVIISTVISDIFNPNYKKCNLF